MQIQKGTQQKNTITMKVTSAEKSILANMALQQNIRMERLVRDLIFKSGLITVMPGRQ
jgi:hypothetical protein